MKSYDDPLAKKGREKMKRVIFLAAVMLLLAGCGTKDTSSALTVQQTVQPSTDETIEIIHETDETTEITQEAEEAVKENKVKLKIEVNGHALTAELADNPSAREFADLVGEGPLTLKLKEYGSFEKVGALPQSLSSNDMRITTEPGDIMLYQGNQITIFYGTNTWSYTPLGRIENAGELKSVFGEGDVTVVLSLV